MSGIERITDKIFEQARLQADNRVEYAREKAEKEKEALGKRLARTMEAEIAKAEAEGGSQADRIVADVMLEGRKKKLAVKQKAVANVFERALDSIVEMPVDDYADFLIRMILPALEKGENELIFNEKDAKDVGEKVLEKLSSKAAGMKVKISKERLDAKGGVIVKNGDIQTNLTLESIVRMEKEKLEPDVVQILFG
jgi:V/A-type H+-transporting ATPase subunit E